MLREVIWPSCSGGRVCRGRIREEGGGRGGRGSEWERVRKTWKQEEESSSRPEGWRD